MTQRRQWLLFGAILGIGALSAWTLVRWGGLTTPSPKAPPGAVAVKPQPKNSAPTPQAVLPFNNGRSAGGAAVPNFGNGNAGGAAVPFNNNQNAAAGVPNFGNGPQGNGVPFAPDNKVAETPSNGPVAGGAGVPSFGTSTGDSAPTAGPTQGGALVPMFGMDSSDSNATAKHYFKQICGDRVPTLQDWKKLVDMKLPDAAKWLHAPIGQGHYLMAMCLDKQNNLWVGTEGEGVYRFSPADGMWTQFVATKSLSPAGTSISASALECGMGDNYAYALACDQGGRVWVGHLNHGVSVFNGEKWQNYEIVGGLSGSNTLSGPLGDRIYHITVCPSTAQGLFTDQVTDKESRVENSVWMCTSAGLAIYFPSTNTWSYLTRAEGLPSDQANSLAFANDGTVFVATQCDGVAIGRPTDGYRKWKQVARRLNGSQTGPLLDELSLTPTGTGLPCNLMNDIQVAKDGTIYAGTTSGLAWSSDKGESWQFVRGKDYAAKVRGRVGGVPAGWSEQDGATLSEDYCTCLSIDDAGNLHVGHRSTASDLILPRAASLVATTAVDYARCVLTLPNSANALFGSYMGGMQNESAATGWPAIPAAPILAEFPRAASPLSPAELNKFLPNASRSATGSEADLNYLGADWATQGNWVGRYGRKMCILCAAGSPDDHEVSYGLPTYQIVPSLLTRTNEEVRNWCWDIKSDERRVPWDPTIALRRPAGWDDHGEASVMSQSGVGLNIAVTVPEGVHRISLYFLNFDGHSRKNQNRDFLLVGKRVDGLEDYSARARVMDYYNGVYQQFVTNKAGTYCFTVDRNYSFNTMVSLVLVDKWSGPSDVTDTMGLLWMGDVKFMPPPVRWEQVLPKGTVNVGLLLSTRAGILPSRQRILVETIRYAQSEGMPSLEFEDIQWQANLWAAHDESTFGPAMLAGWHEMQKLNPQLKTKTLRPNSPFVE